MPLLFILCLTLILWINPSEMNVKCCELPPCPVLERRGLAESIPPRLVGTDGEGPVGQGKAEQDGAVSRNACGCESHSITLDRCRTSLLVNGVRLLQRAT